MRGFTKISLSAMRIFPCLFIPVLPSVESRYDAETACIHSRQKLRDRQEKESSQAGCGANCGLKVMENRLEPILQAVSTASQKIRSSYLRGADCRNIKLPFLNLVNEFDIGEGVSRMIEA